MNGHSQYAEALALYAVGALENAQELAALQAHLGACGECRRELDALRADTALLALSVVGPKPPERARERLLKAIAAEPRMERRKTRPFVVGRLRSGWLSFAPTAVMLLLAVFSLLLGRDLRYARFQLRQERAHEAQLQQQLEQERQRSAHAQEVIDMWNAPNAVRVTLVSTPKTRPLPVIKTIYLPDKGHILMVASDLAPLPASKVYELWLLPADGGAPMPAGTFKPDPHGNGMMLHPMETAGIGAKGFAVTVEPEGGSQTPTMPIVMAPAG